ncbi:hypothetical protein FIV42_27420 [Persicimonas caeni]|uniref:Protein kinase domain-containing protein n=1 Tax=Persicimonas caeni TaxID=2292766 RepID=A0A4Y6Q1M8_PERCE|nr:serine/threonine-protein kinase [Persicimonas caeni]QDG54340.1 hypothetical protein FIV42_27420 [Persicimonas caeni]QED35561.1 protein kinase [Persicimonas caeni]
MSDSDSIVSPGTVLADRYKLTEEIGRGGFGMVYRARQMNMDRDVAIKILPPKFMAITDVVERFRREARLASRLRHPNTITVHDYGKQDNLLFIVMEMLEGEDLADVLMRKPTVSMDRILHIGRQVLKSLHEAHQHNIIHRDLKPENIFLTRVGSEEDFVKVLDFGIAKLAMPDPQKEGDTKLRKLTMSGSTVGTPTYMSPEQAAGEEVDALTDLYALGVILYEMACGRPPFKDDNPVKVMRCHLFEEVPRFPQGPLRGSRFESVIRKALAKEKGDRFASAEEFLKAISAGPTDMLERIEYEEEPPTVELPDLTADDLDSANIAFERTAAYEVEGSDVLSPRTPHNTDAMLAARDSSVTDGAPKRESIPFGSVPPGSDRDRVRQGAVSSSLTDSSSLTESSGLSSGSDLHVAPPGFDSGASSSSIITVLEPGPDDDVILLTNKKGEGRPGRKKGPNTPQQAQPAPSSPVDTASQKTPSAQSAPSQNLHDSGELDAAPSGGEWTWGEEGDGSSEELSVDEFQSRRRNSGAIWISAVVLLLLGAAALGYLHYAGIFELF